MKFQQIRSATAIVTFGGSRFLIDPWLAPKDSCPPIPGSANPGLRCPMHDLPMPLEDILKVDAVIATHLHFDHFDETAMQELKGKDLSQPLPMLELAVKRKGFNGPAGELVGRIRLRQEVIGKPLVMCDILSNWSQDPLQPGDIVFAVRE